MKSRDLQRNCSLNASLEINSPWWKVNILSYLRNDSSHLLCGGTEISTPGWGVDIFLSVYKTINDKICGLIYIWNLEIQRRKGFDYVTLSNENPCILMYPYFKNWSSIISFWHFMNIATKKAESLQKVVRYKLRNDLQIM